MKKIVKQTVAIFIVAFSCSAFANKVVIKGEPVAIEKRGDVYYVPDSYQPTSDYYYVTVEGTKRVCYKEKQPNIALEVSPLAVELGGKHYTWNCYNYDASYFEVAP